MTIHKTKINIAQLAMLLLRSSKSVCSGYVKQNQGIS